MRYGKFWGRLWGLNLIILTALLFELSFFLLGIIPYNASMFGSGTGLIGLDNVVCVGTETRLPECMAIISTFNNSRHNCVHSEDVGVVCPNGMIVVMLVYVNYNYVSVC